MKIKETIEEKYTRESLQTCMDFKQHEEPQDDTSITTAFLFGMALGLAKKYDEMDKLMEEIKKVITPKSNGGIK